MDDIKAGDFVRPDFYPYEDVVALVLEVREGCGCGCGQEDGTYLRVLLPRLEWRAETETWEMVTCFTKEEEHG